MEETADHVDSLVAKGAKLSPQLTEQFAALKNRGATQRRVLLREVEQLKPNYKHQDVAEAAY